MLNWNNLEGKIIKDHGNGEERYFIKNSIGSGGSGRVYLAYDKLQNKDVAIKTYNPNQAMSNVNKRFQMEAKVLSKINHPNIVSFIDYFQQDTLDMIVMEYVEGIPLSKKLERDKIIFPNVVLKYTKKILLALEEIHKEKVYHRDIKPENILITVDDNLKLLDFGIVQEKQNQNLTSQGAVIGTISYLAPEIILDSNKKANARTDLYSVGIVMYQLLTGYKPFKAEEGLEGININNSLAMNIIKEKPLPPSTIDANINDDLSYFVMKLIEKDPFDRYQNTTEALKDLDKLINNKSLNLSKELKKNDLELENNFYLKKLILTILATFSLFVILIILTLLFYFKM
ncbi:MAG: hypothetical protein TYPL_1470 [Candidatus Tyloplasma litorale]|nr:MAG: hypothetical protein TYPL_1470 [Mycoplasmatales bacterium]